MAGEILQTEYFELDYSDIMGIFKNYLKIDNTVKSISSIFQNARFSKKIDYKPYFQRKYVWDDLKATYFIESIFMGTEIPPLVLFDNQIKNEVIDGRQRYETILNFLNNKLLLEEEGLKYLKSLSGKKFSDLSKDLQESFEETKLRILQCSVLNEPSLDEKKEDKIKKEIFRRYNSGIIPLKKEEILRAEYIKDKITIAFNELFTRNNNIFIAFSKLFLPKRQIKAQDRDKRNFLLNTVRTLITLPYIPINSYATYGSRSDIIGIYYKTKILNLDIIEITKEFTSIVKTLYKIRNNLLKLKSDLVENVLFFECCYWILSIIYKKDKNLYSKFDDIKLCNDIINAESLSFFWTNVDVSNIKLIFEKTGSHYYRSILNRYNFIANYFITLYGIDASKNFRNTSEFKDIMNNEIKQVEELNKYKLNKADPTSMTIEDIIDKIKKNRFLIRPKYQRSEVTNPQKSSYLLESIMLGIKIPPIFIYKREDKIFEVIDGQQRLLSILGFLGETYINELGKAEYSKKNLFKLIGLKILTELNKCNKNTIDYKYIEKILDFQLDVVEINYEQNPDFNSIDLFLRLNTKPYPIKPNTFEMWNAYIDKEIALQIRNIAEQYEGIIFRQNDTRMRNEELITSLAYSDYRRRLLNYSIRSAIDIYIRSGRINARMKNKEDITRLLSKITNTDVKEFKISLFKVTEFIQKILVLMGEDETFKPSYFQTRTDQNYYLLWLLLDKVSLDDLKKNKEIAARKISAIYKTAQKLPANYSIELFLNDIDSFSLK